jgi:hypothetical protein
MIICIPDHQSGTGRTTKPLSGAPADITDLRVVLCCQAGLLKSKPTLMAVIEELEKLGGVLKDSIKEELQQQQQQLQSEHAVALEAVKEETAAANALLAEAQEARAAAEAEAAAAKEAAANPPPPPEPELPAVDVEKERAEAMADAVARLLQLLYFAQVSSAARITVAYGRIQCWFRLVLLVLLIKLLWWSRELLVCAHLGCPRSREQMNACDARTSPCVRRRCICSQLLSDTHFAHHSTRP